MNVFVDFVLYQRNDFSFTNGGGPRTNLASSIADPEVKLTANQMIDAQIESGALAQASQKMLISVAHKGTILSRLFHANILIL